MPGSVPSIFPNSKNVQSINSESDGANSLQNGTCSTDEQIADVNMKGTQISDSNDISYEAEYDEETNSTFEISTSRELFGDNEADDGETNNIEFLYENSSNTNNNYELSKSSATLDTYQIPE